MERPLSAHRMTIWLRTVAACAGCLLFAGCDDEVADPEAEIRAWIAAGVEAAENEARRDIVSMISPAYADARGNSRDDIENILRVYFLRADNVTLIARIEDIRIIGDDVAEVDLSVGGAGVTNSVRGFCADAYRVSRELGEDEGWQLFSARWAVSGGTLQ